MVYNRYVNFFDEFHKAYFQGAPYNWCKGNNPDGIILQLCAVNPGDKYAHLLALAAFLRKKNVHDQNIRTLEERVIVHINHANLHGAQQKQRVAIQAAYNKARNAHQPQAKKNKHHKKQKGHHVHVHPAPIRPPQHVALSPIAKKFQNAVQKELPKVLPNLRVNKHLVQNIFTKQMKKITALFAQQKEKTDYVPIDVAHKVFAIRQGTNLFITLPEKLGKGTYKVATTALSVLFSNKGNVVFKESVSLKPTSLRHDVIMSMQHEIEIIKKLGAKAPGIVETHLLHPSRRPNQLGLMLERCDNDLDKLASVNQKQLHMPLTPKQKLSIHIKQLNILLDAAKGLEHMHKKTIFHGDIKPGNILTQKGMQGKITDFGTSTEHRINTPLPKNSFFYGIRGYGTTYFSGPEFVSTRPVTNYYAADIWAFGLSIAFTFDERMLQSKDPWFINAMKNPHLLGKCHQTLYNRLVAPLQRLQQKKEKGTLSLDEHISYEYLQLVADIFVPKLMRNSALVKTINNHNVDVIFKTHKVLAPEKRPTASDMVLNLAAAKKRLELLRQPLGAK